MLTHVYNAHTDGDTWVYFDDANVLDTGDTFTNTGRYNTIDFANGGDIRGLIRAVDAYLKVANDQTKIVPGHGALANKADIDCVARHAGDLARPHPEAGQRGQDRAGGAGREAVGGSRRQMGRERRSRRKNWTRMVYNSFKRS